MATTQELREQPSFRRDSPSPSTSPTPAIGACPELSRCISTASTGSLYSGDSSAMGRDSLGSNSSVGTSVSRSSSASYSNRQSSVGGPEKPKRRGYVRPQGTNFAASAQSRESVLSLGSIAHLQYYFARTGLLDGKGGRLAKKKDLNRGTLDLSALDTSFLTPKVLGSDVDSSYASMGSSPELHAQGLGGMLVESPTQEEDDYFSGEEEDPDHPHMLPPTVSTYNHRQKPIPHPPTLEELKDDLQKSLNDAVKLLEDVKQNPTSAPPSPQKSNDELPGPVVDENRGWHELQGMHVLDIMTLAIRAAKMYYTAHNQPARLAAIKSERKIRAELLSVMDVLKRMATRHFAAGMRTEEREIMENWVASVYEMLSQEEAMEEAERKQRASWTWLDNSWQGRSVEREYAFIKSMDPDADTLPAFQSVDGAGDENLPTRFLDDMRTGMRLVKLHNAVVRKSKRPFGAIDKWHTDFAKPYRCAENLRYWIKAAELRWEVILKVDVMGVVSGTDRAALKGFEDAIWKWCGKVREEISTEFRV